MASVVEVAVEPAAAAPATHVRTVKIGLLGLGQVGQAVARLAPEAARLKDAGLKFRIVGALVRDLEKPRRCIKPSRLTTNPSAFLRGHYDVVIEALGTVEPARSIVARLLGRGIPVVTANKALVAAYGAELAALAARRGTAFRYEASALAAVPFLGAFSARPLVSDVRRFVAVVNGTSNYVLSKLERDGCTFAEALADAQAHGLTEPDASRDVDGLDAADKLTLLAAIFGWGALPASRLDVQGIGDLTALDLAVARALGGTIKPVAYAARTDAGVSAFVGPAFVAANHPLASLHGSLSGIHLQGAFVSDLFFSGPGAGPDITAATIVDDAVEAVTTTVARSSRASVHAPRLAPVAAAPATAWLVRATFPGVVPEATTVRQLFASHHLDALHVTDAIDSTRWVQVAPVPGESLQFSLTRITSTHRVQTFAIRAL